MLKGLDIDFTVDTGNSFTESVPEGTSYDQVPVLMAEGKSAGFHRPLEDNEILITADTMVILPPSEGRGGEILGKPRDAEDAARMLRMLSGRTHQVYTGVSVRSPDGRLFTETDCSDVAFCPVPEEEILAYVRTGEPLDKAGAYALQGRASLWITRLEGSYSSVIGLPLYLVRRLLLEAGYRFDGSADR